MDYDISGLETSSDGLMSKCFTSSRINNMISQFTNFFFKFLFFFCFSVNYSKLLITGYI